MPLRVMRPADADGYLDCEHETRDVYAHPDDVPWTRATLKGYQDAGYKGWVWARSSDGLIVAGVIGRMETLEGEKWLCIVKASARLSVLAGTIADAGFLRPVLAAVQEAMQAGSVGVRIDVEKANTRLTNFLDNRFKRSVRKEDFGHYTRFWYRHLPGLPELTTATPATD